MSRPNPMPPARAPEGVPPAAPARRGIDGTGLACLLFTVVGWGLNWPAMKHLVAIWPPFRVRGLSGGIGALVLVFVTLLRRESLRVPRALWGRLALVAFLNVSCWMGLTTLALLWLRAGEAAIVAYTAPLWTVLLAWPVLGEKPRPLRIGALLLGLLGIAALLGQSGGVPGIERLPGFALSLGAALTFALGTVVTKRFALGLPPTAFAAWQVILGCLPMIALGLLVEHGAPRPLTGVDWPVLAWASVVGLGFCYISWFGALRRLPAGVAASGTLLTPLIGALGGAVLLGEPFGLREVVALCLSITGVVLALRA